MKKTLLIVLALSVTFIYSQVNVTFYANTSVCQGVVPTSGIDLRGTVTQWGPGTNLTNVGGDYWEITIQLAPGDYEYKYGAQIENRDGTVTDYWENDIPGAIGGAGNRLLTVGSDDMVLELDYVGDDYTGHPRFTPTDNIDIFFRVNVSEFSDFDPTKILSFVGGGADVNENYVGFWDPGLYPLVQEGDSDYWNFHLELDPAGAPYTGFMYRFHNNGTEWGGNSENVTGHGYYPDNENRGIDISEDMTVQWVWWNDQPPKPFEATDVLESLTFSADVATAIASDGFEQGDKLLVKWGYGGTQQSVRTDELTAGFGTVYSVTIPDVGVDFATGGIFYQYYRVVNDTEYREIFYNFNYEGDDVSLAERRLSDLAGATALAKVAGDYAAYTINDNAVSNVSPRRMPKFRNANKICAGCGDDNLIQWTYVVDMRPAYAQVAAGSILDDIQGDVDITEGGQITALGVYMNGPATVDQINTEAWTTWGGTLAQTEYKKMYDDGATDFDAVAGDQVYSNTYIYQSNATELGQEFKFGIGGGDNEGGYGNNHIENLTASITNTTIFSVWGSIDPNFYNAWNYDTNSPNLDVELTDGVPNQFKLGDNYPNPFNPTTTVAFSLPIGVDVTLNVYNLLGEKVATIYNSYAQPGNYTATWNGLDAQGNQVPSGTYLFELDAGAYFHQVKKMTMMK